MNELKVGFLTLIALSSIVVVSLQITADKRGLGSYIEYQTILTDATGVYENSSIKVAGIDAGIINSISLSGSQALVTFEVKEEIKVTQNTILKVKSIGFLGDKYIDLYLGDPNAERLPEGELIIAETGAGLEDLSKDASLVLKDVKEITGAIKDAIYDQEKKNRIESIIKDVQEFSKNAKQISQKVNRIIDRNEKKINDVIDNVNQISEQLAFETDRNAEGSLMHDLAGIKPIIDNVNHASEDIKMILADVRAGKGTVGKLLRDDEVVDQVNETLSGVNQLVNRINNYKTDVSIYSGVNDRFGARTDFNVDIIPGPERFFRLGVVLNDYGPEVFTDETKTATDASGNTTTTSERIVDEEAMKFNLQIGRRVGDFTLRAGLIETTGGVGLDYDFSSVNLKTFVEAFDYQEDVGPNVRVGGELKLWNVFYTKVMGEDVLSETGNNSFTVSAGVKFSDEDLAALLGIMAL